MTGSPRRSAAVRADLRARPPIRRSTIRLLTPESFARSVSVVICTRNRPDLLRKCLTGVSRLTAPPVETVVVDDASEAPGIEQIVAAYGAKYIHELVIGVSRARNTGLRAARGEIVACVDDDAFPDRDWIANLVREFEDPRVAAVVGRTIPGGGPAADDSLPARLSDLDGGPQRRVVDRETPHWFEIANFGGLGAGANMAFRRSSFEAWGGFDERIGYGTPMPGLEEHNAFFRVLRCGFRIVYTPTAVVYHPITFDRAEARRRRLARVRSSAAYALLLFVEHRKHRRALLQYAAEGLRRKRHAWRTTAVPAEPIPAWRLVIAILAAPLLYVRARSRRQDHRPANRRRDWRV